MVFELLNPELQKIVKKRFKQPTLPQQLAFKPILEGKNVLVIAATGTGKTESVMLPLFHLVMEEKSKPIAILYITPLRSLNRDLLDRLLWWCNEIDIEASVRHGDTSPYERRQQTEFPPQLLITTPETLQAILPGKRIREHLRNVKWVVIDEIHEIADSKRGTQLSLAIERLRELASHDFQMVGLSATIGSPEKVARFLCPNGKIEIIKAVQPKGMEIKVINPRPELGDAKMARKLYTSPETAARLRTIMELVKKHRSTLVFTNTREFAEILSSRIKTLDKDFPIGVHHSSLSKDVRIKAEKEFKEEKLKGIVSTSSLQLGIDIGSADLVLQYMSPRTISQCIQRIGRSGHEAERVSKGIIISTDEDDIFESTVIARKALAEELEPLKIHENSYDVLAHQLVGLTMDSWKIDLQKAYDIVRRAYPYQKLSFPEFLEVCKQLQQLGLIFLDGNIVKKRRGFEYYFTQLSTIPDTKQYRVVNSLDNSFVGVLDEEFVALHGESNTTFILKGEAYKIISVEEDKIFVEPIEDIEAAIPGWEGELIPVPFEVAQEVGRLRSFISQKLEKKSSTEIIQDLVQAYPVDENCARGMLNLIKKQDKYGIVPDDKTILIENHENSVILHTCFGSVVNETLGRLLSSLLTARIGSVGLKVDPYRIILHFQVKALEVLKEVLFSTNPEFLGNYTEMHLSRSNLFEWKFVHVAKRFGAISRNAEYGKVRMGKIIESYTGSPIFKETLKELETEKLDIEKATEILKKIQSKDISVIFKPGLSPLGMIGLRHEFAELVGPPRPELEIFGLFKKRLMNTRVRMVCVNCGQWQQTFVVKEVSEKIKCTKCEARLLGIVHTKNMEAIKIVKKKIRETIEESEKENFERIVKSADLFLVYGKKAAIALAARGVGPETAKRILARFHKDDDALLKDILDEERRFIRTRKYWSS
jgi:ATP-dependent Lhr-like helicase